MDRCDVCRVAERRITTEVPPLTRDHEAQTSRTRLNVWRSDHQLAFVGKKLRALAQQVTRVLQVFDHLDGGDQVKTLTHRRSEIVIQIGLKHRNVRRELRGVSLDGANTIAG